MLKYFFYDMDDTLVKTWEKWHDAIKEYLSIQNLPYNSEAVLTYLGKNCKDICLEIDTRHHHIGSLGIEHHANIFRDCLLRQFNLEMPQEIPGASKFLSLMSEYVEQYVVSGSPLQVIEQVIQHKGWSPFIANCISSETVARGKPDPLIYTATREKLGVGKEECLIFEDSPAGVEAARRAGIRCVCVNPRVPIEALELLVCSVPDFKALIDSKKITELMNSESRHKSY
jgi:beta-phosphoglucomutase-like phosphatase (HAD superfamily)